MIWQPPEVWDVLLCNFPESDGPDGTPGPKARPVFVAGTGRLNANELAVMVIYGTSQKMASLFPGEFVIDPVADSADFIQAGLQAKTKFNLNRRATLVWSDRYFSCPLGNSTPLLGSLSKVMQARAAQALRRLKAK